MRRIKLNRVFLILCFAVLINGPAIASEGMTASEVVKQSEVDPNFLPLEAQIPGQVEGTGTYFEITDSDYLNVTVESSEVIHLRLESIPETIVMDISSAGNVTTTQLTLGGFEPLRTYYKYEDDYSNGGVALEMDSEGMFVYDQDLSRQHLVFIQSRPSTKFIPSDTGIGVWDSVTRTYTLTTDVNETIQVDEDDLTIEGSGHIVTGFNTGNGLYLNGRADVTINNLQVTNFTNGIFLNGCDGVILADNVLSDNSYGVYMSNSSNSSLVGNVATDNLRGIYLYFCNDNSIEANTANYNDYQGIYLQSYCKDNVVAENTAQWNGFGGIDIGYSSNNNELSCNTTSNNDYGIRLDRCGLNVLTDNTAVSNSSYGIVLWSGCYNNELVRNGLSDNDYGLYLGSNFYTEIYNNNFINNVTQVYVSSSNRCVFYMPAPVGGNYWSDWTEPDDDGDGFVDLAYVIASGGRDELPLAEQAKLLCNQPPVAIAGDDQVVVVGDTVVLDGSASHDDNQDELTYSWGFVSWPEGSDTELVEPTSDVTSFVADIEGEYVVSLVVNDGLDDSEADTVSIKAISVPEALDNVLAELDEAVGSLDEADLRNKRFSKPLSSKIDAVIRLVYIGDYADALKKLERDLLGKMNGCIEDGEPDNNDWIVTCERQEELYDLVREAIDLLDRLN
jgi:parallel beta-helix repeat protein